jgi:hypothetical protein
MFHIHTWETSMRTLLVTSIFSLLACPVFAQDCRPFLPPSNAVVTLQMVSMNKNGVSSYVTSDRLMSRAGGTGLASVKQQFSDRLGPSKVQPFAVQQPDQVTVSISVAAAPQVVITLLSWGDAKATFTVSCAPSGVMHGSTSDNDYLLFLRHHVIG